MQAESKTKKSANSRVGQFFGPRKFPFVKTHPFTHGRSVICHDTRTCPSLFVAYDWKIAGEKTKRTSAYLPQVRTENHLLHQNFPNLIYISARMPKDTIFISLRPRYRRGEPPMPISGRDTYCACACGLDCSASRGVTINSEPTAFSFLHSCRHHTTTAGQLYTFERSSHVGNM